MSRPPVENADPELRTAETFPTLTDAQMDEIRAYGEEITAKAGAAIYQRGDRNVDFYVVLDGAVDVSEIDCYDERQVFHTHRRGSFLGEINLFNSRKSLVGTQAAEDSRLIRVGRLDFRRMLSAHPELAKIILRAAVLRRESFIRLGLAGTTVIGDPQSSDVLRLRRFLTANDYPYKLLPPDTRDAQGRLITELLSLQPGDLPVVWDSKNQILRNPCLTTLAYELGLMEEPIHGQIYDLVIVGGGPSGLAAAVYAGSEGLDTLVIESWAPGGQAGTSSQIENYLGFPNGISGWELASRAQTQAQKFGVQVAVPRSVRSIEKSEDGNFNVILGDSSVPARSVIVASGAKYRKLDLPEYDRFEGRGIQYAASAMEAQLCAGKEVVVVGGGNSAGQAAVFLSQYVAKIHMLIRGKNLSGSMSRYLVERIDASPRIEIHYEAEITNLSGDPTLEQMEWKNISDGSVCVKPIRTLFVMIGALPNTDWLQECIELDNRGFVVTGRKTDSPYETSVPGIFAIGDVRSGSVKRVASAVGEGSIVLSWVHQYLNRGSRPKSTRMREAG